MRFKAIRMGFMGHRIRPGQTFEAADDFKCKWAEPCVAEEVEEPDAETEADPLKEPPKEPEEPDPPKEPAVDKPKSKAKKD